MKNLVCGLLLVTSVASAEEIRLRDGSINLLSVMAGESEITLEGRDFSFDGYGFGRMGANQCVTPCDPGETVDLGAFLYEFYGPAIFQDEHYNIGVWDGTDYIYIEIEGSMRVPRHREGQDTKIASARVKIDGDFYHAEVPLPTQEEEISGYAKATVQFTWCDLGWMVTALNYDIRRR